jgi:phosphoesterase RecJ-like protein
MPASYKKSRDAEDIKREITAIIRDLKDPRVKDKLLTVVRIELAPDLSFGRVYVSAMEGPETAEKACEGLEHAQGLIRKELSSRLRIRKSPELKFIADDSVREGIELWENFKKENERIKRENTFVGKKVNLSEAAEILMTMDKICVLAHENPDGDAVGSAYGLARGLVSIGKKVKVELEKYSDSDKYLSEGVDWYDGEPDYYVSVDTADKKILGVKTAGIEKNTPIALNLDHHVSNTYFAVETYADSSAAAAAEVVFDTLNEMKIPITKDIAECLYIGISTDTGCFRYGNTTAKTLRTAADLAETGIDLGKINRVQFETKTKAYAELERQALSSMRFFFDGKAALITVTNDMFKSTGADDTETQALNSLTRQIEGVLVGITMKEKTPGMFRVSIRTNPPANAQTIAASLGGGGHTAASGCSAEGTKEEAEKLVLEKVEEYLKESGLL